MVYWKRSQETLQVLQNLSAEIQKAKNELVDGALIASPVLEREYCRATGYIAGLQYIEDLLKEEEVDNDEFTEAVFGPNSN